MKVFVCEKCKAEIVKPDDCNYTPCTQCGNKQVKGYRMKCVNCNKVVIVKTMKTPLCKSCEQRKSKKRRKEELNITTRESGSWDAPQEYLLDTPKPLIDFMNYHYHLDIKLCDYVKANAKTKQEANEIKEKWYGVSSRSWGVAEYGF